MKNWRNLIKKILFRKKENYHEKKALTEVFMKETSVEEKYKLLDHIFSCPQCQTDFEAIKEVWKKGKDISNQLERIELSKQDTLYIKKFAKKEIKKLKSQKRKKGRLFLHRKSIPVVAAAGTLILISAILTLLIVKGPHQNEFQRRIGQWNIKLLEPHGEVEKSAITFSWFPVKEAKDYTLEILDRGLETIYISPEIKNESYILPRKIYNRLKKGEIYFWKITAFFQNNQKLESDLSKFKIK